MKALPSDQVTAILLHSILEFNLWARVWLDYLRRRDIFSMQSALQAGGQPLAGALLTQCPFTHRAHHQWYAHHMKMQTSIGYISSLWCEHLKPGSPDPRNGWGLQAPAITRASLSAQDPPSPPPHLRPLLLSLSLVFSLLLASASTVRYSDGWLSAVVGLRPPVPTD